MTILNIVFCLQIFFLDIEKKPAVYHVNFMFYTIDILCHIHIISPGPNALINAFIYNENNLCKTCFCAFLSCFVYALHYAFMCANFLEPFRGETG